MNTFYPNFVLNLLQYSILYSNIQIQYITFINGPVYIEAHLTYQIALLREACLSGPA